MENSEMTKQNHRELMMLNDPIPGVVVRMAIPTIVAFLSTSIVHDLGSKRCRLRAGGGGYSDFDSRHPHCAAGAENGAKSHGGDRWGTEEEKI